MSVVNNDLYFKIALSRWCISGLVPDCRCRRCLKEAGRTPTKQTERAARLRSVRRTKKYREEWRKLLGPLWTS